MSGFKEQVEKRQSNSLVCNQCGGFFGQDMLSFDLHAFDHIGNMSLEKYGATLPLIAANYGLNCPDCPVIFFSVPEWTTHLQQSKHGVNCCQLCGDQFQTLIMLEKHLLSVHGYHNDGRVSFTSDNDRAEIVSLVCPDCKVSFSTPYMLAVHWRDMDGLHGGFMCEICHECFFSVHRLRFHEGLGHKVECPHCLKFISEAGMKNHLLNCRMKK